MPDGMVEREALGRLMAALRPSLHRYCARMVGSAFDGEDVVQEAFARATEAFAAAGPIEQPDRWLFRIAHNAGRIDAERDAGPVRHGGTSLADALRPLVAMATSAGPGTTAARPPGSP